MGPGLIRCCFDTVILIDHLNDRPAATEALATAAEPAISIVSWIEVMAGMRGVEAQQRGREFLDTMRVEPISAAIADEAAAIRRTTRLKLPDAIILATARHLGVPLLTRNSKDFGAFSEVVIPYTL